MPIQKGRNLRVLMKYPDENYISKSIASTSPKKKKCGTPENIEEINIELTSWKHFPVFVEGSG
jgi:hypothetical protein